MNETAAADCSLISAPKSRVIRVKPGPCSCDPSSDATSVEVRPLNRSSDATEERDCRSRYLNLLPLVILIVR